MVCIAGNLLVLHKMNPVAHGCQIHGLPTVLGFAPSRSNVVCLFTGIYHGDRMSKCCVGVWQPVHSSLERTSADVCLMKSMGSYMIQTLNIMSSCTVHIALPHVVMVKGRFCFVQVNYEYYSWHTRRSLPVCGTYVATSTISSINKANR